MPETSNYYLPSFVQPYPGTYHPNLRTIVEIERAISGPTQRQLLYQMWEWSFQTQPLTMTQHQQLRDFLRDRSQGGYLPFNFFEFNEQPWVLENLGVSDGTNIHTMPFTETNTITAVRNRTTATNLTYTLELGTGLGGEDKLKNLLPVPTNGNVIEATFSGRKRFTVLVADGQEPYDFYGDGLVFDAATGKYLTNYVLRIEEAL